VRRFAIDQANVLRRDGEYWTAAYLAVGALLKRSVPTLNDAEAAAYDAPSPDASYKARVRAFPQLVMTEPDMPGVEISQAAERFWSEWDGASFLAVGAQVPVLGVPAMDRLRRAVRGAPAPLVLADAGHVVQERSDVVAQAALISFGRAALDLCQLPVHHDSYFAGPFIAAVRARPEHRSWGLSGPAAGAAIRSLVRQGVSSCGLPISHSVRCAWTA